MSITTSCRLKEEWITGFTELPFDRAEVRVVIPGKAFDEFCNTREFSSYEVPEFIQFYDDCFEVLVGVNFCTYLDESIKSSSIEIEYVRNLRLLQAPETPTTLELEIPPPRKSRGNVL